MDQPQCNKCKKNPAVEGKARCALCLEKGRSATAAARQRRKAANICDCCMEKQRRPGGVYCEECLIADREQRKTRKLLNQCVVCGSPAADGKVKCIQCVQKQRNQESRIRRERKADGICIKCGKVPVSVPHVKCETCLSQQAKAWHEKTIRLETEGLCVRCGDKPLKNNRRCRVCYLKHVATKRAGGSDNWFLLDEKFKEQSGICPYTGRVLSLGLDATVDHKTPRDLGGSDEIGNLQWVYSKVNTMKWTCPEEEFLLLVEEIYKYRHRVSNEMPVESE